MTLGLTFNGIHSSAYSLLCYPHTPMLPDKRPSTIEIPGRNGTYDFAIDSYAPRIIPVACMIRAADRATLSGLLAQAAVWLSGSGYLIFDHDPGKRWEAKVYTGIDLNRIPIAAQFTIAFECQPFAEDATAITGLIGAAQDYGSPVECYPVITVTMTGTAASVQVSLLSNGRFVKVSDSLVSGDVLVFDMSTGKVTKNSVACMAKVSIDSLFFSIPPGSQTITVTTTGTYTASISYRRRYLFA